MRCTPLPLYRSRNSLATPVEMGPFLGKIHGRSHMQSKGTDVLALNQWVCKEERHNRDRTSSTHCPWKVFNHY